jgi:hypothetical protein
MLTEHREAAQQKVSEAERGEEPADVGSKLDTLAASEDEIETENSSKQYLRIVFSRVAAQALWSVTGNPMRSKKNRSTKRPEMCPCWMSEATPVPRYDAWVPVNKEFWVGTDLEVEPYMPWFGDDEEKRGNAFELYRRMAKLVKDDTVVSDGELDEDGNFCEPPDEEEAWRVYDSAVEQRRRGACRAAISAVVAKFDRSNPIVFQALAAALDLGSWRRVAKMLQVVEAREEQSLLANSKRQARKADAKSVAKAWTMDVGYDDMNEVWDTDEAAAPLAHFCFTCHIFHCPRHLLHNVEPIIPIKDSYVELRISALKKLKPAAGESSHASPKSIGLKPCGSKCHLLPNWDQAPDSSDLERSAWSKEERLLFKEAIGIFKKDPCSIAMVVGPSKSCVQVAYYLQLPEVVPLTNWLIGEATKKRWPIEVNRGGRSLESKEKDSGSAHDSPDDTSGASVGNSRSRKQRRQSVSTPASLAGAHAKSAGKQAMSEDSTDEADNSQEADFVPCAHPGPCDKISCTCFTQNLKCEATCGCNCGRWTVRGYETPGNKPGMSDRKRICRLRHWGCSCPPDSHCNTSACECWEERRSCDPDFCDHCQANVLPSQITASDRGCRNVGVPIGRHKRTIVGKSAVHGFGLFAAEVFEEGDLVGIYGGQIMDTKKADTLGFLYDAKDHTFFFDVTQSLVVDGGVLGMKSKFVNHVQGGSPEENCMSRCVRVRGMAHIALFATRRVVPGEEFRFDYKFQVVVPDWAKRKIESEQEEVPDRKPETPGRFATDRTVRLPAKPAESASLGAQIESPASHGSESSDLYFMDES